MIEEIFDFIKENPLIVLLILGFSSYSIFYAWGFLTISGNSEEAETVKNLPDTVKGVRDNVSKEATTELIEEAFELNEERKQVVSQEEDPFKKNIKNIIYLSVIFSLLYAAFLFIKILIQSIQKSI
jgi:TRAP-type C4-dicarboxylate transport system permease small subunit